MKLSNIILGVAMLGFFTGCEEDPMNYKEYTILDEEYIQEKWDKVAGFTTVFYNDLDYDFGNYYDGAMLSSATDESVFSHAGNKIERFYNGAWSPTIPQDFNWKSSWEGITYCNLFLDKFNNLKFEDYSIDKTYAANLYRYNNFQYEARWCRAYFYFNLVRQYGGVPLKTEHMEANEANSLPRVSTDEIFNFIDSECDAIKDTIIKDWSNLGIYALSYSDNGRANDLAVMALRARAALYYASPLFNPNNDASRWQKAAQLTKALIDSCEKRGVVLDKDYAANFGGDSWKIDKNPELIFGRRVATANSFEKYNFPIGMSNAQGGNCPTQNLVDAYEMKNGKAITDPESGYDPQNPYVNRDKRLSQTIAVNGEQWPADNANLLETFYGGANALPTTYGTPTGYYLKKYCNGSQVIAGTTPTTSAHTWVIFRLGEFYLNYAEALINIGDEATARTYINKIRKRAGQPDLDPSISGNALLAKYRNERFVELAFEGHRFFDLRRWKIAGDEQYRTIKTMDIQRVITTSDTTLVYTPKTDIASRAYWDDKMYLFPIPQEELLKSNGGWEQNQGW